MMQPSPTLTKITSGAFQVAKPSDLIPELQGRLPIRVELEALSSHDFKRILTEPKNALLKQYEKLFELEGINMEFTPEAIAYVAEKAIEYNLGARGLRSICEAIMTDAMFEMPSQSDVKSFIVDRAYAETKINKSK